MNLRTLKKKSKQSAPLLRHYLQSTKRKHFIAERGNAYHGLKIRCPHPKTTVFSGCRHGCECHPLKGTPMIGWTSGYYEPEWYERTAYEELCEHVRWGGRAETMTDAEWSLALRVTGEVPLTEAEIAEMARF